MRDQNRLTFWVKAEICLYRAVPATPQPTSGFRLRWRENLDRACDSGPPDDHMFKIAMVVITEPPHA